MIIVTLLESKKIFYVEHIPCFYPPYFCEFLILFDIHRYPSCVSIIFSYIYPTPASSPGLICARLFLPYCHIMNSQNSRKSFLCCFIIHMYIVLYHHMYSFSTILKVDGIDYFLSLIPIEI